VMRIAYAAATVGIFWLRPVAPVPPVWRISLGGEGFSTPMFTTRATRAGSAGVQGTYAAGGGFAPPAHPGGACGRLQSRLRIAQRSRSTTPAHCVGNVLRKRH
jgi:hypothetical protein